MNSQHQRAMRRISPHNPVRRRLFPEAHFEEEARMDNCANVLQESIARDQVALTKKYNFDFATETALPGEWDWSTRDGENWIGFKPNTMETTQKNKNCVEMRLENETTPKEKPDKELPAVRKRKSDAAASDSGARRKISFD
ncbi:uncharacterized protein LOC133525042 isoform X2 [Cydia pomonella]|uniref:uncharacterized protein LOC133525042 isoform X2 n=1 Tax=Cydia pomonella TaxID=82600 RepID=UPI002ADD8FFB|nr:uncharacterized protein LOC133525042 isoform X2 [Cydia pomonella]